MVVGFPLPPPSNPALIAILALMSLGVVLTLIIGQIHRYQRASTPVQRQQTTWAVYGLVLSVLLLMLFWMPFVLIPALSQPDALFVVLKYPAEELAVCVLAVTFAVAILRYQLYDIDLLINRSLVYVTLTGILAVIYGGGVIGLQALVNGLTRTPQGESSPLLIVVTTLLIAALFQPLRRPIQAAIDRAFYRRKYDAARTLTSFGAALRTETDLGSCTRMWCAWCSRPCSPHTSASGCARQAGTPWTRRQTWTISCLQANHNRERPHFPYFHAGVHCLRYLLLLRARVLPHHVVSEHGCTPVSWNWRLVTTHATGQSAHSVGFDRRNGDLPLARREALRDERAGCASWQGDISPG